MPVTVKRYRRHKMVGDKTSEQLYYLQQEPGTSKTETIETLARAIEITGSLSAGDVVHSMEDFSRELKKVLIRGDRVKVDKVGIFHMTFRSKGAKNIKDCTVKSIQDVHVRFIADKALRLVNDSTASTRGGDNNVAFHIKGETGVPTPTPEPEPGPGPGPAPDPEDDPTAIK